MDNQEKDTNQGNRNVPKGTDTTGNANGWDSYSGRLGSAVSSFNEEDDFLQDVKNSLAQQISSEMEDNYTETSSIAKKKKFPKGLKIFTIVFSCIMLLLALLAFTPGGQKLLFSLAGNYIYNKLDYQDSTKPSEQETNTNVEPTQAPVKVQKEVINILLVGVEEIGGASNTDSMMVASMNTKDKSIKLTSLMRDLYVEIPGHDDNKLNAAFALGGIDLLYQTIQNNFGVELDGYAMVNFESFEQIVDLVGGVEVTLTSKEANYLNTTNYISDPAMRTVHEGTQLMTGNQALGYCRVRYVSTGTESNDFGRTQRQRAVLSSIFEKLKSKNLIQLGLFLNDVLNQVKIDTDITNSEFNDYLQLAASLKLKELENFRVPTDGSYGSERVPIGKYNVEVLVPTDWDATKAAIHDFIYGSSASTVAGTDANSTNVSVTPTVEPASGQ